MNANGLEVSVAHLLIGEVVHRLGICCAVGCACKLLGFVFAHVKVVVALHDALNVSGGHHAASVLVEVNLGSVGRLEVKHGLWNACGVCKGLLAVLYKLAIAGQSHAVRKRPVTVSVFACGFDCAGVQRVDGGVSGGRLGQGLGVVLGRTVSGFLGLCPCVVLGLIFVRRGFDFGGQVCTVSVGLFNVVPDFLQVGHFCIDGLARGDKTVNHVFVFGRKLFSSIFCKSVSVCGRICRTGGVVCFVGKRISCWRVLKSVRWIAFVVSNRAVRNISPVLAAFAVISHFITATNSLVISVRTVFISGRLITKLTHFGVVIFVCPLVVVIRLFIGIKFVDGLRVACN